MGSVSRLQPSGLADSHAWVGKVPNSRALVQSHHFASWTREPPRPPLRNLRHNVERWVRFLARLHYWKRWPISLDCAHRARGPHLPRSACATVTACRSLLSAARWTPLNSSTRRSSPSSGWAIRLRPESVAIHPWSSTALFSSPRRVSLDKRTLASSTSKSARSPRREPSRCALYVLVVLWLLCFARSPVSHWVFLANILLLMASSVLDPTLQQLLLSQACYPWARSDCVLRFTFSIQN